MISENTGKFYINGAWVDPTTDTSVEVINPATEEEIGRLPHASIRDLDDALALGRGALLEQRARGALAEVGAVEADLRAQGRAAHERGRAMSM